MSELFFIMKCLVLTAVIVALSQIRFGGSSLEEKGTEFLHKSSTAVYVQSVAAGGALAIANVMKSAKKSITGTVESLEKGAREQKAGR